jgi:hypothetical protein
VEVDLQRLLVGVADPAAEREEVHPSEHGDRAEGVPELVVRALEAELREHGLEVGENVAVVGRPARGTQFRQWATNTLRDYLTKGFVTDDDRLMAGCSRGADYFDELLERIRAIRASERRFYQKITDIYATRIDYDKDAPITQDFYATVQNKLHWAIHGRTAAETIAERADATKPNMGLTT